jgi:DNA transposition AAA+ family ATPase
MHPITPIIRTGAYSILRDVSRAVLETARLGIVRGPVGIGKTFALRQIAEELSQGDDQVFLIEAPSDKSKAVRRFYQSALFDLGVYGHGGADPFDVFTGYMLRSYPFRRAGQRKRILLIVDECQRLAPNILETLRHAYDAGQLARDGMTEEPAFGILLVGNHHFLKRTRSEPATFEALRSRSPIKVELSRPEPAEYLALSEKLFPENEALRRALEKHGAKRGNLREMAEAHALALHYAGGGPISTIHLEKAMLFAGGTM